MNFKVKTYSEFINESLRIKNDTSLQDTIDSAIEYLKNETEVMNDIANRDVSRLSFKQFLSNERSGGYKVCIDLLYDEHPDPYNNFNGAYIKGSMPPYLVICVDPKKLYDGNAVNSSYLSSIRNTMEHELTHFIQDETRDKINKQIEHAYIDFDDSQYTKSYAAHCASYILYQLFNDDEFEAFLTSGASGDTVGIVNTLNEAYIVSLDMVYDFSCKEHTQIIKSQEILDIVKNDMERRSEEELYGPEGFDYAIAYTVAKTAEFYGEEPSEGEEHKYMKLFYDKMVDKYAKFMHKYLKVIGEYQPQIIKDLKFK